ncbi:hypothetical protein HDU96_011059, partial [Phlyctochytrium bullatum]
MAAAARGIPAAAANEAKDGAEVEAEAKVLAKGVEEVANVDGEVRVPAAKERVAVEVCERKAEVAALWKLLENILCGLYTIERG